MKRILLAVLIALCLPAPAQTPLSPINFPVFRAFDSNGKPLNGGKLFSYAAGTTTPLSTFTDATGSTPNTNPVILDSTGTANIFLGPVAYKFVLQNQFGVQQWTVDNILLGAGLVGSPSGSQTIIQPNGTTFNINSLNNVLEASLFPGADIGAKVNNAIGALGSNCGKITVAPGNYTLSTTISKPRCVLMDFNNAVVTSTLTGNKAAIVTGTNLGTDTTQYTWGGIKNLKLIGPGFGNVGTVGIWLGGDSNGAYAPLGVNDYLETYENVNIQNFETGMMGGIVYQDTFVSDALNGNSYGYQVQGIFGSENMNMFGMQIINNQTYGFYAPNMPAGEYTCTACSIDYTGPTGTQPGIFVMNGTLNLIGGHMEHCSGYQIDGPVTLDAAMRVNIVGMTFVNIAGPAQAGACVPDTTTEPAYIHVTGNNSAVDIGTGVELIRNHPITSLVNWEGTGGSNALHVQPYSDPLSTPGLQTIPAAQLANIASLTFPFYDQFVSTSQYFNSLTVGTAVNGAKPGEGSIYTGGFIGTDINLSGVVPPTSAMPFSGIFLGWNSTNFGDADFYSPFSSASTADDAYDFFVNYASSSTKIFSIDRSGSINANGAIFKKGNIQLGTVGSASTIFSFATAPSGGCTNGDIGMNRAGTPNALYVCQSGAWVGK